VGKQPPAFLGRESQLEIGQFNLFSLSHNFGSIIILIWGLFDLREEREHLLKYLFLAETIKKVLKDQSFVETNLARTNTSLLFAVL
jgi:hypothetical protein